uniref:Uncharacterized protein n=1 Tax=Anguilla anguilla TaxID=7936 RepID=A0A0E9P846_ANGAN
MDKALTHSEVWGCLFWSWVHTINITALIKGKQ